MNDFDERINKNENQFDISISADENSATEDTASVQDDMVYGSYGQSTSFNNTFGTGYTEQSADDEITIDLSGGYGQSTPNFSSDNNDIPGMVRRVGYTENIQKKKKGKTRFVAAMVALTMLNLAIMGGMYTLGKKSGNRTESAASKQELIEDLRDNNSNDNGTVTTAVAPGEMATTEIAKKIGPAVVGIRSTIQGQMSIFGTMSQSAAEGSGIILSQDGYIVTNNHVVDGAASVKVILNTGTEYDAKLIGKDEQTDLAVIKIEPTEQLTVATLGDSNRLEVGERVVAIGNPMGLEFFGSVTEGIVSAVNRTVKIEDRSMNLIQTDAAINSGNSGGALINKSGEIIGINSVKVSTTGVEGMGFAIPSSEAKTIIADLMEHGYVKGRPVIGISTRDVSEYMSQAYSWPIGVQVMEVNSQSARDAGLQQGDIITEVDGQKVTGSDELNEIKSKHNPGDVLKLQVYKYSTGRTETVEITLSEQIPG